MTLQQFIAEHHITTFEGLKIRCGSIGVEPPTQSEFIELRGNAIVSSPSEGVVVLDPAPNVESKRRRRRSELESSNADHADE